MNVDFEQNAEENALDYLLTQSERLTNEVDDIEGQIEYLENNPSSSFNGSQMNACYKRLVDRSALLTTNLCQLRLKVAECMATGKAHGGHRARMDPSGPTGN